MIGNNESDLSKEEDNTSHQVSSRSEVLRAISVVGRLWVNAIASQQRFPAEPPTVERSTFLFANNHTHSTKDCALCNVVSESRGMLRAAVDIMSTAAASAVHYVFQCQ